MIKILLEKRCVNLVGCNMNLSVYNLEKEIVFEDNGNWIYPLFYLEEFIKKNKIETKNLILIDKIIGKGAAILIIRLGILKVFGKLISKLALELFEKYDVDIKYDVLVEKIQCKTEDIIKNDMTRARI